MSRLAAGFARGRFSVVLKARPAPEVVEALGRALAEGLAGLAPGAHVVIHFQVKKEPDGDTAPAGRT